MRLRGSFSRASPDGATASSAAGRKPQAPVRWWSARRRSVVEVDTGFRTLVVWRNTLAPGVSQNLSFDGRTTCVRWGRLPLMGDAFGCSVATPFMPKEMREGSRVQPRFVRLARAS